MAFLCRYLLGVVMLSFQAQLIKRKFCGDTNEGIERCCTDYKYVPGTCEPCYGSFGIDCVNPCSDGFYGHGCKMKCNCSSFELCDRVIGCVENSNIICKSNVTAEDECCRDYYRNGPESCEPCIGSRGYNCSIPCEFGFFGHGCREKCNCTSDTHWCDAEVGCIQKNGKEIIGTKELQTHHLVLTAAGSIGVSSGIWIMLIILYKWQRRRHCIEKKDGNLTDDMVFTPKQQQNENGLGDSRISKERNQILAPSFISCQLNDDNSACNSSQSRSERMVKNTELHLSSLQTPQKDGYCHNKRTDSQKRSDLCKVSSTSPDASRNLINENLDELNLYQNFNAAENMCSVPDTTNANLQELGSDSKALGPDSLQQQRPYSSVKYNRNKREDKQENALDFASDELQMEVGKSSNVKDIDEVYGFDMKEVQCMRSHEILK